MKILLRFITKHNKFPLDYRRVCLSFFKRSLSEIAEGKYFEKYYFTPERRNFTFAVNLPMPKFSKTEIELGKNEISITFSTADSTTGYIFASAFIKQKGKHIPAPLGNEMILTSVSQVQEKTVSSNSALVKMLSPLCLRIHNAESNSDKYVSVADENFNELAEQIIKRQLNENGFDEKILSNISIKPLDAKKTVVYHYKNYIECSLGTFIISGDRAVINYLLKSGIGSRKSAGFGFAQLIAEGDETD